MSIFKFANAYSLRTSLSGNFNHDLNWCLTASSILNKNILGLFPMYSLIEIWIFPARAVLADLGYTGVH